MFGTDFAVNNYWWLLLLIPLLFYIPIMGWGSLSGIGRGRWIAAVLLRAVIMILIVLALAEAQFRRTSDKMTVIYLLDQSESIPAEQRRAMLDYAVKDVAEHRNHNRGDMAGVIAFGREAAIEVPPFDFDLQLQGELETAFDLRRDATNLAGAMKLAQSTFPEDSAKRIVIVTDGNENLGDSRAIAELVTRSGIGIDVVPINVGARSEVEVEKVTLPDVVRKGQPFRATMVLNNMTEPSSENPSGEVRGKLRLVRRAGGEEETLEQSDIVLSPGKNVFQSRVHEIERSQFYTYEARFEPEDAAQDTMRQNNIAQSFTHVRGKGHVLLIEDANNKGEFQELADVLRRRNIEVTVRNTTNSFSTLADLQAYDCVILANVPRSSPDEVVEDGGQSVVRINKFFTDDQIDMLVRNTQQMGAGIVMIGGERSFGAGDWAGTELEKAMPVDFTIKNAKIRGVGALVMLMHACEMPQGNHWEKVVARQAVQGLGSMDYCGLLQWTFNGEDWLWKDGQGNGLVRVGGQKQNMSNRIGGMTPGDMPEFDPAMKKAAIAFNKCTQATTKHMIIISDGDPSPPTNQTMNLFTKPPNGRPVQISTVAIGTHGAPGSTPLQKIAQQTGGKYYVVNNAAALPRIYQREVRRVARPLIYEKPVVPTVVYPHEMLSGINVEALPTIKGFVYTQLKQNPLVEVSLIADQAEGDPENHTILASWTYGLGRTAVFTTDTGTRWAPSLRDWEYHDQFFTQMVEWSMRPTVEEGKFHVTTDVKDGKVQVIVSALDKDDEFLNFLEMGGQIVGPDNKPLNVPIRQVAPGRYVGEYEVDKSGAYLVNVSGKLPRVEGEGADAETKMVPFQLRSGVSVPYSEEFRSRETNRALLDYLATLPPAGGEPGEVIEGDVERNNLESLLSVDTFRHNLQKAISVNDIWPWLIFAMAVLFLGDVFIRRVQITWEWLSPVTALFRKYVFRQEAEEQPDERMARLKSRKQQATASHEDRRAAARFEPQPESQADLSALDEGASRAPPPAPSQTAGSGMTPAGPEAETYTERLMKAKREALKGKQKRDGQ